MTYSEALRRIYGLTNYETRTGYSAAEHFDLSRMNGLIAKLGHPEKRFGAVHIAGTKGKGSVSAMIDSVLRSAGYATGLYTSPHLHTFRERIRVNGTCIPEEDVAAWADVILPLVDDIPGLTTFEVATAMAFAAFAEAQVDVAVLEVGLGGRLDATNVIRPLVSVLTSISYDHTQVLGNTLSQIAREKAGIIKPYVPVISAPQADEALEVIEETCLQRNAALCLVGRDWNWEHHGSFLAGQSFSMCGGSGCSDWRLDDLWVPLLGEHQTLNATVAAAALQTIGQNGIEVHSDAVRRGLRAVKWPGRLEILHRRPLLVVDGAHNGESCRLLASTLQQDIFRHDATHLIFGALSGHDHAAMLSQLLPLRPQTILTRTDHPRATDPATLLDALRALGADAVVIPSPSQALEFALSRARPDDLICAAGSLYIVADVRRAWLTSTGEDVPVDPVTS